MASKHMTCHINNSGPGHVSLKQQSEKNMKVNSVSPSKNTKEKKKRKTMAITKLFALHANAINRLTNKGLEFPWLRDLGPRPLFLSPQLPKLKLENMIFEVTIPYHKLCF